LGHVRAVRIYIHLGGNILYKYIAHRINDQKIKSASAFIWVENYPQNKIKQAAPDLI